MDELKAVVFATYSEPELMRRGAYYSGKKSRLASAYIAGEFVDDSGKRSLMKMGMAKVLMDFRRNGRSRASFDKERGVVILVRKQMGR